MWGTIILQTKCCGLFFTVLGGGGLVTKSCLTLVTPMDCSPLGFSVHEILQTGIPESEREVAQSCPILCDPMDCSL